MKKLLTIFILAVALRAPAQWVVLDPANLEQAILQFIAASNQLFQTTELLSRLGDPAAINQIAGAARTFTQMAQNGVGRPLMEIQISTTGEAGLSYVGQGLYRPVEPQIPLAQGQSLPRPSADYRKHEAFQAAAADYNAVTDDTDKRRSALRAAQRQTVERLAAADTEAEVNKLTALLQAQQSELGAVAAEKSDAATRVIVQAASNQADKDRQAQADLELRAASLQSALRDALRFFKGDSKPTSIPDPNQVAR